MKFQIRTSNKILHTADCPQNLDYSILHKITEWEVWVVYDKPSFSDRFLAFVNWQSADRYAIRINKFSQPVGYIQCHNRIIPTVQGALETWYWEKRFDNLESDTEIIITPEI